MKYNEYYNIRVTKIRRVKDRVVCDLINGDGTLILSGNVDWVQNLAAERGYVIENAYQANLELDALLRKWGVY